MKIFPSLSLPEIAEVLLKAIGPSVLLASTLWVVKHTADRYGDSPVIEYRSVVTPKPELDADAKEMRVSLKNLSLKSTVRDSKFQFVTRTSEVGRIGDTRFDLNERRSQVYFYPPAVTTNATIRTDQFGVAFEVPTIPPEGRIDLVTIYRGSDAPRFVGSSDKEKESFALVERGPRTILVSYEILILYIGLVIWGVFLAFLIYYTHRNTLVKTAEKSDGNNAPVEAAETGAAPSS